MGKRLKIRFLAIFSIIFLCVGLTPKIFQNDTFYIIKLGDFILKNGIDLTDHYCWVTNLAYTYPHWLYDVFVYIIYNNFSFGGVYVSTIFLFIILILSIYKINLNFNQNEFMALFVSIISIACLYAFATARAQLVSAILFLWQVYFIEKLIQTGRKKYIFYLVVISWLVANLHATIWLFYFILYLPFLAEHFIFLFANTRFGKNKFHFILNSNKVSVNKVCYIKEVLLAFGFSFLMGIFTPSKICYSYIFKVMQGNSQSYIMEHAPMVIIQNPCFMAFILVILVILIFSKTKIKLKELFMLSGLLLMSLVSIRHVAFFYIIGVVYVSILSNRYLIDYKDKTLDFLSQILVKNRIICFVFIAVIVFFSFSEFQKNAENDYVPIKSYPVKAVDFIKNNLNVDELRLYNDYNVGSYLLFNDIPVFIDSRCDLYLSEFNGLDYSIFDDAAEMNFNYEKKFKFYDISHVLVSKKEILFVILNRDQDYELIYEDKNFALFKRLSYEEK